MTPRKTVMEVVIDGQVFVPMVVPTVEASRTTLGQRLKMLRESRSISREKLGDLAKLARNVVNTTEDNISVMRTENLLQVFKALKASPSEVLWVLGIGPAPKAEQGEAQ